MHSVVVPDNRRWRIHQLVMAQLVVEHAQLHLRADSGWRTQHCCSQCAPNGEQHRKQ